MGKKSKTKREKDKKAEREKNNGFFGKNVKSLDDINYKPIKAESQAGKCFHGDAIGTPAATRWNLAQRKRWMEQGMNIATFGQRYSYYSTLLEPNKIPIVSLYAQSNGLVDKNWS